MLMHVAVATIFSGTPRNPPRDIRHNGRLHRWVGAFPIFHPTVPGHQLLPLCCTYSVGDGEIIAGAAGNHRSRDFEYIWVA